MIKLRIRKDCSAHPSLRWRIEIADNPVGDGISVGWPSWVDAMVDARTILIDVERRMDIYSKPVTK